MTHWWASFFEWLSIDELLADDGKEDSAVG
jgi:hypothetical protein